MEFTLHAGPMKTGSTAVQRILEFAEPLLASHGLLARAIRFGHPLLRLGCADEQQRWLSETIDEARARGCERILISNEFLCVHHHPEPLAWIAGLRTAGHTVRAVLVRRALTELYPSLYLQNLKGPVRRTTSFRDFVQEQMAIDEHSCWSSDGTTFHYGCLRSRLEKAGAEVVQVDYSRASLVEDVLRTIWPALPFDTEALRPPQEWIASWRQRLRERGWVDNTRSLSFALAPVAVAINELCVQGVLDDAQRNRLMVTLLEASTGRGELPEADRPLLEHIAQLDARLHAGAPLPAAADLDSGRPSVERPAR